MWRLPNQMFNKGGRQGSPPLEPSRSRIHKAAASAQPLVGPAALNDHQVAGDRACRVSIPQVKDELLRSVRRLKVQHWAKKPCWPALVSTQSAVMRGSTQRMPRGISRFTRRSPEVRSVVTQKLPSIYPSPLPSRPTLPHQWRCGHGGIRRVAPGRGDGAAHRDSCSLRSSESPPHGPVT